RAQQCDRECARSDTAFDHGGAWENVAPYEQRSGIFRINHLRGSRQMRNQVGVGRPQDDESLARAEFHARSFLESVEGLGLDFATNRDLLSAPKDFQVTAALAVDKQYGVVFFKEVIQLGSTLRR